MRAAGGWDHIIAGCEALGTRVKEHIAGYGHDIESRLTGAHETAPYNKFSYGVSNRGASIRIPAHVARERRGYLEDRRPNANVDPYVVTRLMLETVCGAATAAKAPAKKAPAKKAAAKKVVAKKAPAKKAPARRKTLRKVVAKVGALSTFRKLNAVAVYTKRTAPKTSRKMKADRKWVKKNFM